MATRVTRSPTISEWIGLAPLEERFVPITYNGTVLYDRESKTESFAEPTPEGRIRFRKLFRSMSSKAAARGYRKA